jgi:hypothetical protein
MMIPVKTTKGCDMKQKFFRVFCIGFILILGINSTEAQEFVQVSKVVSPARGRKNEFSNAMDLYGDYAIIGEHQANENTGTAHSFKRDNTGKWNYVETLSAPDIKKNEQFGNAVCIHKNFAAVTTMHVYQDTGAVFMFEQNSEGKWEFKQKLIASDGKKGNFYGYSVSIYDDFVFVGAKGDQNIAGATYVYKRNSSTGMLNEVQKIVPSDSKIKDYFGTSISVHEKRAAISANGHNGLVGAAYIFECNSSGTWQEKEILTPQDGKAGYYFGGSVCLRDDYLLIGAYGVEQFSGLAYMFKRDETGKWKEMQILSAPEKEKYDGFGNSVSLDGDRALIGAPGHFDGRGAVFLFKQNGDSWEHVQKLTSSDFRPDDSFGRTVCISGDAIGVSAVCHAKDTEGGNSIYYAGAAYFFHDSGTSEIAAHKFNLKKPDIVPRSSIMLRSNMLQLRVPEKVHSISLTDMDGRCIPIKQSISDSNAKIFLPTISNGLYLLLVTTENGSSFSLKILNTNTP